ncbi:hypothetical protein TPHA_0G01580 [Tetrapisispora phaffii CBS 4417]|uniref:Altered inheritance of mitochondria protein 44 n=1 Tax=Tetrapisispora phaffii (strain ATCC 24235 / CBS 4417 / NBRC 1672 / NRRL Y-8282 / UCD 70-5) TaxID=1071381 RepID=G8BVR6_TETPH|nr:hypothetical protein TPHA_0G01580 [Tetrapisispora phaffii CBS 4417]CCE63994.1 hypothetical protein TPHA_0G01580 [Tetrapisispora phaffii CBS 4417]
MAHTLLRTPTRTKTKSFNGTQMDFKFPSIESLPNTNLQEPELNNHHLLNDNINDGATKFSEKEMGLSQSLNKETNDSENDTFDTQSQILSDYTSQSNAHSSNGYYSFANISDNTTSMQSQFYKNNKNIGSNVVSDYYIHNENENVSNIGNNTQFRHTLAPERITSNENLFFEASPRLQQRDNDGNNHDSNDVTKQTERTGLSETSFIPKGESLAYRIESSESFGRDSRNSVAFRPHVEGKLGRKPTIKRVSSSSSSSSSRYASSIYKSPVNSSGKRVSQLKRSNAVRCKGGLLQFFTMLAIKFGKCLEKLGLVLRKKLFSFKEKNNYKTNKSKRISRSNTFNSNLNVYGKKLKHRNDMKKSDSNSTIQLTSHIQRTKGNQYPTSNKSKSHKSLEPVLAKNSKFEKMSINPTKVNESQPISSETNESDIVTKTASLRRTPSSIRRAASVFTTSSVSSKLLNNTFLTKTLSKNSDLSKNNVSPLDGINSEAKRTNSRLTRSSGVSSLNSLMREPSIVVKNKVIPLTMKHYYPIKEETEDEDTGKSENEFGKSETDEYIIDTSNGMHSVNSEKISNKLKVLENETDSYLEDSDSYLDDDTEFVSLNDNSSIETELAEEDMDGKRNKNSDELKNTFSDYFSQVIYQRIKLRLEVKNLQESTLQKEEKERSSLPTIQENSVSGLLTHSQSLNKIKSESSTHGVNFSRYNNKDIDSMIDEFNKEHTSNLNDNSHRNNTIHISVEPPFKNTAHSSSVISFQSKDVHRSLTLPIRMTV